LWQRSGASKQLARRLITSAPAIIEYRPITITINKDRKEYLEPSMAVAYTLLRFKRSRLNQLISDLKLRAKPTAKEYGFSKD
jgi:hypothetical protein